MRRPLLLTLLLLILAMVLLVAPASAHSSSCTTLTSGFEVCFLHVSYDPPWNNISTFTYLVKDTGASNGLSNWALELCDPAVVVVAPPDGSTYLTLASFLDPDGTSYDGPRYGGYPYTVEVASTGHPFKHYGFVGIKWDYQDNGGANPQLGEGLDGEYDIFQFSLLGGYDVVPGKEMVIDVGSKSSTTVATGYIDGPACNTTYVELSSYRVEASRLGTFEIAWETAAEIDNAGFQLYRAPSLKGPYTRVNEALIVAKGDADAGASYTYMDSPGYGTFYYRLMDIDFFGTTTTHDAVFDTSLPRFIRPVFRPMYPAAPMFGVH